MEVCLLKDGAHARPICAHSPPYGSKLSCPPWARPTLPVEQIQRRARVEPFELCGAESVVEPQRFLPAVRMFDAALDRFSGRELRQSDEIDAVALANTIVVVWLGESERQQPLLLQIGLVNAREAPRDDGGAAEQTGRQRRVLAA